MWSKGLLLLVEAEKSITQIKQGQGAKSGMRAQRNPWGLALERFCLSTCWKLIFQLAHTLSELRCVRTG